MWAEELKNENALTFMDRYSHRTSEHNPITPAEQRAINAREIEIRKAKPRRTEAEKNYKLNNQDREYKLKNTKEEPYA